MKGTLRALAVGVVTALLLTIVGCKAAAPGSTESKIADEMKNATIGGKNLQNPSPDTQQTVDMGKEHFQHHCMVCHGLDGHNTGVQFADQMSPPTADLGAKDVQHFSDGQLKWIIQNGIRFTGMPVRSSGA